MEPTYITWNVTNWVTIVLMAALGFMLSSFFLQLVKKGKTADA